jgi:hypothetical protein
VFDAGAGHVAILLSNDDAFKKLAFLANRATTELIFCYNQFVCICIVLAA